MEISEQRFIIVIGGDTSGRASTDTNCNTTYTPPKTVSGNRVTVDNAAWVTDVLTGDEYLIQCTAGWVGSLLCVFRRRKIDTVLVAQFLFAKTQE
jgi:hypothetical protein